MGSSPAALEVGLRVRDPLRGSTAALVSSMPSAAEPTPDDDSSCKLGAKSVASDADAGADMSDDDVARDAQITMKESVLAAFHSVLGMLLQHRAMI